MSQIITQPPAARWASWYVPELAVAPIASAIAAGLISPGAAVVGVVPLAAIGVQELYRLGSNALARRSSRRRAAQQSTEDTETDTAGDVATA